MINKIEIKYENIREIFGFPYPVADVMIKGKYAGVMPVFCGDEATMSFSSEEKALQHISQIACNVADLLDNYEEFQNFSDVKDAHDGQDFKA